MINNNTDVSEQIEKAIEQVRKDVRTELHREISHVVKPTVPAPAPASASKSKFIIAQPKVIVPRLTQVWHKCLEHVAARRFEAAYSLMLTEGDDLYLLHLIA